MRLVRPLCLVASAILLVSVHLSNAHAAEPDGRVQFVRDIQPILSAKCVSCHGPDEQEGQLRLDAKASVFRGGVSGRTFEVGKGQASLLYRRITSSDEEKRMPPDDEPLSAEQVELLRRWIDEGAKWPEGVGANVAIESHWAYELPKRPALPDVANREWLRSPIDAFVLRQIEQAKLQPSPRADEATLLRRAYLDLVGLPPSVEAIDVFLASDAADKFERVVDELLASPQYGIRWARPWLDAARYADSNGYQADQYRSVWPYRDWVINAMNADMPFDRFTLEQIAGDLLPEATMAQRIATGFHRLTTCNVEAGVDPEENRTNQIIDRVNTTGTVWLGTTIECAQCHNHKYDPFTQKDYYQLFAYFNNTPLEVEGNGVTYNFTGPRMSLPLTDEQAKQKADLTAKVAAAKLEFTRLADARLQGLADWVQQVSATANDSRASQTEALPKPIAKAVATPAERRTKQAQKALEDYFADLDPKVKKARAGLSSLRKQLAAIAPITALVMVEEEKARATAIFGRGSFKNRGEGVSMATPAVLPELTVNAAKDRRELARWIVSKENPLTARVAVNRWWAELFGRGIVETLEDFGTQGERPTHPQLLDWLAIEFVESGWSMKHVHKQIVLSATYQQSSKLTAELVTHDPYNHLYARAPRFRLPAETIRDNALMIAGVLSRDMAGPPIYPPQPDNIWRHVGRNAPKYDTSQGNNRFRRGIYVIWRRSAPYPSFTNFDAPDRASCVVKRPRTNTPLQALTLMNDPAYVELAIALAERIVEQDLSLDENVAFAFRSCVAREPGVKEVELLADVYLSERQHYEEAGDDAIALVGKQNERRANVKDLAAWFHIANILLNLGTVPK